MSAEGSQKGSIEEALQLQIEEADQDDDENDPGQGIKDVDEAHHQVVQPSAGISGDQAVDYANQKADGGSHESDQQGNSSPVHQPRQKIATVEVRAQPMLGAGRSQPVVGKFAHAVRAEDRSENSRNSKDSQESEND